MELKLTLYMSSAVESLNNRHDMGQIILSIIHVYREVVQPLSCIATLWVCALESIDTLYRGVSFNSVLFQ